MCSGARLLLLTTGCTKIAPMGDKKILFTQEYKKMIKFVH